MGIMDKLRAELVDIIEWIDDSRHTIVWRFPRFHNQIKNIPILSTLLGWYHGFDSPFKAEVYFVNTTRITDLKWGTPNPVIVRDPDLGPVRIRAFGTYSLQAQASPPLRMWHVAENGEATGPFAEQQLVDTIRAGRLRRETLVWGSQRAASAAAGRRV
jgi:membrane protease subunit (stomatin/prohibitin family)